MLAGSEAHETGTTHLCRLQGLCGLQLPELHGIQLLTGVQTRHKHWVRKVHKLGLPGELEGANVAHRLTGDRATCAMSRLEYWGLSRVVLLLGLCWTLIPPVAIKVARARAVVSALVESARSLEGESFMWLNPLVEMVAALRLCAWILWAVDAHGHMCVWDQGCAQLDNGL